MTDAASNAALANLEVPMTKLTTLAVTTTMTMLLSQATGCIIHTTERDHGDDGGQIEIASISARWAFRNMADGATTACPSGFDSVELIAQAIDVNGDPVGAPNIDLFDCDARTGISTDLAPDVYQVWLEVRSHDLSRRYAQSLSQVLDLRDADQRFEADILNDGGFFQLSWDLVDRATNRPLSCGQAGATGIHAISTSVADSQRIYDDVRSCDDHFTVTEGLLEGVYTVRINALDRERPVGNVMTLANKRITGPNGITDLGHILLPVTLP